MPYTKQFRKLLKATKEYYGKEKGKNIAFALAKKYGWKV